MIPFPFYLPVIAMTFWEELLRPRAALIIHFDRVYRKTVRGRKFP